MPDRKVPFHNGSWTFLYEFPDPPCFDPELHKKINSFGLREKVRIKGYLSSSRRRTDDNGEQETSTAAQEVVRRRRRVRVSLMIQREHRDTGGLLAQDVSLLTTWKTLNRSLLSLISRMQDREKRMKILFPSAGQS